MTRGHVLIIVQNLPVPLDRRVWLECQALTAAGFDVSVICPKGPNDPGYQELSGVHIYKYAPPPQANGALGYLLEFVYCWLRTAKLTLKVWHRAPFHVMQACNPPDTYWALARLWRARGVKFVFDHHDLNPEVFRSRFGEPNGLAGRAQLAGLYWLERKTFHTADRVISTNQSYQRIAWERGDVPPEHTTVVRSGPDTTVMKPGEPKPELRNGREHLVSWLGIMGPQDGVDGVLEIAHKVVREHGREDVQFALLGFGDCLEDLKKQCTELGLDDYVTFTGRVGPKEIADYLSTSSLGLSADPLSPLNDVSTMNKTMEYMAYALPVVAYRLTETVVSAGDCAVYLEPGDADGFAKAVIDLLDDPTRRKELGTAGRTRAEEVLDWRPQAQAYVGVYESLFGIEPRVSMTPSRPAVV
ncbi:glycosyltransferase family 4 protein [Kibdelosporangium philippinense]|uniref:Glycosyltransferase family 4 protein n=1 Tax=Kibdelosporangium philippinense TaxID=211113 RepID=A0ABS8ZCD1_9PSEU|nr:glycosyltransferase family 4 protein [Kibdelosporangium philippinense]MCE7005519.1 glycosyltransferase family 4 protein [Kibdelosporangium philippinense]